MMTLEESVTKGVYFGEAEIPCEIYSSATHYVRNSCLTKIAKSPSHYLYCTKSPIADTASLIVGRAMHAILLEPELEKVIALPRFDRRRSEDKVQHAQFVEEHRDKIIVPEDDYLKLLAIRDRVLSSETARKLLTGGKAEHSFFWKDPETQISCKARLDKFATDYILDLKTTSTGADTDSFEVSIGRYLYHHQAAFYRMAAAITLGIRPPAFIFLAVETEPPFGFAFHELNDAAIEKGEELVRKNLSKLKRCLETDAWPGYSDQIHKIGLPSWAF